MFRWNGRWALVALILISVFGPLLWNHVNLLAVREHEQELSAAQGVHVNKIRSNAASTLVGTTIYSIDNEYYLSYAENARLGLGFGYGYEQHDGVNKYSAPAGPGAYIRRMPGYPVWYSAWRVFGDLPTSLLMLRIAQLLLVMSGGWMLYRLLGLLGAGPALRWLSVAGYALVPWVSAWAYYTLTEALTPALTLATAWQLAEGFRSDNARRRRLHYMLAALFLSLSVLTRPMLALGVIPISLVWMHELARRRLSLPSLVLILLLPVSLYGSWILWAHSKTNEWVLVERAAHPTNPDRVRPPFIAFGNLLKASGGWINWKTNRVFNASFMPLFGAAQQGDTRAEYRKSVIEHLPLILRSSIDSTRLDSALREYQSLIAAQCDSYANYRSPGATYSPEELALSERFEAMSDEFRGKHPWYSAIVVPLQYVYIAIVHSHTAHLFVLADNANVVVRAIKGSLLVLHVTMFALCVTLIILCCVNQKWVGVLLLLAPLLSFIFLTVVFREYEQRYLMPYVPLMWCAGTLGIRDILTRPRTLFLR